MEQMPKVSVIIPVYNAEKYLRQCLDSVVNQTLREIEIICVDDGSTDGSLAILREYEAADSRVKVLTQENQGAGVARNNGMAAAHGEYFAFWDADDFFELSACEVLFSRAAQVNADVVIHNADLYNEDLHEYVAVNWLVNYAYLPKEEVFNRETVPDTLFQIAFGGPCNKLYRQELIHSHHLRFPAMRSLEDVPFVYTALAVADRITHADSVLAHYRRKESKKGLVSQIDKYPDRIFESYRILKDNLTQENVYSLLERSFINRAASDFVDQYKYHIIKDKDSLEYFKLYLSRVASFEFKLRDKPASYFHKKVLYDDLLKLYAATTKSFDSNAAVLVSIIVPCYNSAPFLRQCINSILNQSFSSFQLILVDDGSTDDTLSILNAYKNIDSRIAVLSQKNQYAGVARNYGMSIATGKYLLFLDSDDFFEKTFVGKLYHAAEKYNSDIVICDGYYFNTATGEIASPSVFLQHHNLPIKKAFSYKDIPDKILHITIDCPWNKLFKREFIQRHNLTFQNTRSANDIFFVDSALLLASRISTVDERLIYYRKNVKTSLQATRAKEPLNFYQALTAVRSRIEHEPCYSSVRRSLLSLFIAACRFHLNNAQDKSTFLTLYEFYKTTAFAEWALDISKDTDFVFSADKKWVDSVLRSSAEEYLCTHQSLPFLKPPIIVSLTSYPLRISTIHKTIETLLNQTLKADKVVLWLAEEEFPNKEKDLPAELIAQTQRGLEIAWCHNIRSYKKLIPALKAYPDAVLVTTDDDNYYHPDWLEKLYRAYLNNPDCIQCHRITKVALDRNDEFVVFPGGKDFWRFPSYLNKLVGAGGVLYPPHCFHPDVLDEEKFMTLAPTSDDIWFWLMAALAGYRVNVVPNNIVKLDYVEGTQDCALCLINDHGENYFWVHFKNILKAYPQVECRLRVAYQEALRITAAPASPAQGVPQSNYHAEQAEQEIRNIRASASYRIGRFITWIPRMVRGFFRCYQEHGAGYTWQRVLFHLHMQKKPASAPISSSAPAGAAVKAIFVKKNYNYYRNLTPSQYPAELCGWFKRTTGQNLDLENPKTFNEKLQWLKLYDSTPLKTRLADKYLVRDWVKEKIGEEYLIPLLGVWDSFDEIDFDALPNQFVLKANHGCGWNIIVTDKSKFDKADAKKKFDSWMKLNFAYSFGLELQYLNIPPKIIAEAYVENAGDDLYDYKVFCFDGRAESIMFLSERKTGLKMAFYDLQWNKLPFTYSFPRNPEDIPKPQNLDLLISLAEKLSEGFAHVRVDFYILNDGTLKFGEMTFTSASGSCKWNPPEQNRIYGDLITLPPKSPIPQKLI